MKNIAFSRHERCLVSKRSVVTQASKVVLRKFIVNKIFIFSWGLLCGPGLLRRLATTIERIRLKTLRVIPCGGMLFFCTASAAQYVLMVPLYNEPNPARMAEYLLCFERNMQHSRIEKMHVIYDTSRDDQNNRILRYLQTQNCIITYVIDRPTYAFCFDVANQMYPDKNIILANADIFFNKTLELLDDYDLTNQFLALTRWDVAADGTMHIFKQYDARGRFSPGDSASSQDVWIFKTPLPIFQDADIAMGTMTCDSLIAYQAHAAGLVVRNPCLSIQCCHVHVSEKKQYDPEMRVTNKPIKVVPWESL